MKRLIAPMTLLLAPVFASTKGAEEPRRPNIVVIIADDLAWDDCGAFGNPKVGTPNIDAPGPRRACGSTGPS